MDLYKLAARTHLPVRKLRYVIDHNLVPGLNLTLATNEAGRPRKFADDAAFGVAWMATLLDGGMQRTTAKHFIATILDMQVQLSGEHYRGHQLLSRFMTEGGIGYALLADGVNVCLRLTIHDLKLDTDWRQPQTGAAPDKNYLPRLTVESELTRLRDQIFGRPDSA